MFKHIVALVLITSLSLSNTATISNVYGFNTHDPINDNSLDFLQPDILEEIKSGNTALDSIISGQGASQYHYDDCEFQSSTEYINQQLRRTVDRLDPSNPSYSIAAWEWGKALHPAQDFYSHANWVDIGITQLVDDRLIEWEPMTPYSTKRGMVIVEGEDDSLAANGFVDATRNGKIVTLYRSPNDSVLGLISGSTYFTDNCPDKISLGHWDGSGLSDGDWPFSFLFSWLFPTEPGLEKDSAGRENFDEANDLAEQQTVHEWCRLVNLTHQRYGIAGIQGLYDNWVIDEGIAWFHCYPDLDFELTFLFDGTSSVPAVNSSAVNSPDEILFVEAFSINGEWYPTSQFNLHEGDECELNHYHTSTGSALSIELESIPDPVPEGCGFGTISELIRNFKMMTQSEIDAWESATGLEIIIPNVP